MSIGLPVRNGARFLGNALDSVLAQTFRDFEIVVSDNASEDETADICRTYAAKDPRIRYVRTDVNLGAVKNFNRVFDLSSGEYFVWLAHDDWWSADYLAMCVQVLDAHPEVVLCFSHASLMSEDGKVIEAVKDPLPDLVSPAAHRRFHRLIWSLRMPNSIFGVMRASALRRTGLLRPELGSDRLILAEMSLLGSIWQIPQTLFFRRPVRASRDSRSRVWWDPNNRGRLPMRSWRLVIGHLRGVRRSAISPVWKVILSGDVLARFTVKEGRRMLAELWHAVGVAMSQRRRRRFLTTTSSESTEPPSSSVE